MQQLGGEWQMVLKRQQISTVIHTLARSFQYIYHIHHPCRPDKSTSSSPAEALQVILVCEPPWCLSPPYADEPGCVMAWTCMSKKLSFILVDPCCPCSASLLSAGMMQARESMHMLTLSHNTAAPQLWQLETILEGSWFHDCRSYSFP
jgi:hypothetical protein